jgi:prepilin-type N-terminal cleavage/methylation domain-containing protein
MTTKPATRRAFTLLELVAVVVIIALLSAVAIPRWANALHGQRVTAAANRVVEDIARTQHYARITSQTRTITFTPASHSYQIMTLKSDDHPAANYVVVLSDEPYRSTIVSVNFSGTGSLSFSGYGAPNSGGSVRISCAGVGKTISVDGTTGRATVN